MSMVESINHIGIAVRSIAEQRGFYEDVLGARFEGEELVPDQMVRVAFFRVGEVRIELLEPTSPESPVARFMEKRGMGVHHIAYTVADIEQRIAELRSKGVRMVDESPRSGAHHTRIAFIHPRSSHGVLTEICEPLHRAPAGAGKASEEVGAEAACLDLGGGSDCQDEGQDPHA